MLISGCYYFQDISRREDTLSTLKAMREQAPSPQLERDISHLEKELESYSQERLCYEAQILRVSLLSVPILVAIEGIDSGPNLF